MNDKAIITFISFLSFIIGVAMIVFFYDYKLVIALYLLFVSHNLERHMNK
jgi:hypothetical protein